MHACGCGGWEWMCPYCAVVCLLLQAAPNSPYHLIPFVLISASMTSAGVATAEGVPEAVWLPPACEPCPCPCAVSGSWYRTNAWIT